MSRILLTLAGVLALATCLAVAQEQSPQNPPAQSQPEQTQQAQPPSQPQQQAPAAQGQSGKSSKELESAMTSAFQKYPELSNVKVKVADDKIELSGTVPSQDDKDKARRTAEANADGRKVVDDDLKVGGGENKPSSEKPPMSEKPPIPPR